MLIAPLMMELAMAELVAAVGVPHSPHYPSQFPKDGQGNISAQYRAVKAHLDAARADVIAVVANDHFNTFFLNNFPTFAIGVADSSSGPNDQTKMPRYEFVVHSELAAHVLKTGMNAGFDFAVTQEFGVDHAMLVPLHYLTDAVKIPVVPIWINAFLKPLPSARRCHALGTMLKGAIDSLPRSLRVAVMATGHFSLEIAGPRVDSGERHGTPDIGWSKHVHGRIRNAEIQELLVEATPEQMWKAGNIGGELLNWIVMLATVGNAKPCHLADHDDEDGHTFAAWRLS
jgi:aromatic ring-opening dioxygenase catalytic subunit (LigB family)